MMNTIVETLPVLFNEDVCKIGKLRKAIQEGVFDGVENPLDVLKKSYDLDNDEALEYFTHQEETEQRNSSNIEALYELVQIISNEMRFVLQPNYTGKIRQDNVIQNRITKYYEVGIKLYARQIRIYIDTLIQVDGFPAWRFGDYRRLETLIMKTNGIKSEEYLLRLLSIARQCIPPNLFTSNSYVIDSNTVDPNKVSER